MRKLEVCLKFGKKKFNFIINDISGISEDVAKISPWFKNVSCKSGKDGTKLTIKVIKDSKKLFKKKRYTLFSSYIFCK